jgi:polysaccharide pyruvyl transferase WcaK-like protein
VLFGAAGDTGNLGVSALMHAALGGVARCAPDTRVTVFDNGWGVRSGQALFDGKAFAYRRCGARLSKRYHRAESFANMRLAGMFGGLWNAGARAVLEADAVWDVSGGDSFGDLYGERILRAILAPKLLALRAGKPLVLLPQTYGPFRSEAGLRRARDVVQRSRLAWARDARSFEALRDLAGEGFDPERHRAGVDLAFALAPREPVSALPDSIAGWLKGGRPLVGVNVSGLIHNDPDAPAKYGLAVDYRELMGGLMRRLLEETEANVVLIAHVVPTGDRRESDVTAARELLAGLGPAAAERVALLPPHHDASEVKWLVSHFDWFCGTRMHATIGALSSGVPTSGLAYSLKMEGVFESCGQGTRVADLRAGDAAGALASIWSSYEERDAIRRELGDAMPAVRARADEELDETLAASAGSETG